MRLSHPHQSHDRGPDGRRQEVPASDKLLKSHAVPTPFRQPLSTVFANNIQIKTCVTRNAGAIPASRVLGGEVGSLAPLVEVQDSRPNHSGLSPDLPHDPHRQLENPLGVELSDLGAGVAQHRLGRLQAVCLPDQRGPRVPQLSRRPGRDVRPKAGPLHRRAIAVPGVSLPREPGIRIRLGKEGQGPPTCSIPDLRGPGADRPRPPSIPAASPGISLASGSTASSPSH
jgi:hypothetical protein